MHHMVLAGPDGLQYLVSKGRERMMMADPPVCEALIDREGRPGKGALKKKKNRKGGGVKLLKPEDPLVLDCLALFHRTALDTCGEDFDVKLIDASMSVIDGLRVQTHVTMVGPAGKT